MPKLQQQLITFRSHFEGGFGGSAVHPAGVGRGGIPQQALHSHSKSPSVPRQRSRTTLTPVHQEGFGPAPSTSSTPAPLTSLPGRFGHISLHGHRLLQAAKALGLPPAQPARGGGAGSPEASWSSFPPPLGGLLQKA